MVRECYSLNTMFTGMDKYFLINKYLMGISMCQKLRTHIRQWLMAPFQVGLDFVSSPLLSDWNIHIFLYSSSPQFSTHSPVIEVFFTSVPK